MDLFSKEQMIYDEAIAYLRDLKGNGSDMLSPESERYNRLLDEYGNLLRQFRALMDISDRVTHGLNARRQELQNQVHYDMLTGIFSRRYLDDTLERIIRTMTRADDVLSVMMVDIDYFKPYNDTYGESAGDDCLRFVAEALKACLYRADDFVSRHGGEEFTIVLPRTHEQGARIISERVLAQVRGLDIPHVASPIADYVTVSIGIATGRLGGEKKQGDEFLAKSTEALNKAKSDGRNRYVFTDV